MLFMHHQEWHPNCKKIPQLQFPKFSCRPWGDCQLTGVSLSNGFRNVCFVCAVEGIIAVCIELGDHLLCMPDVINMQ